MDRVMVPVENCPSEDQWSLPQGWSWTKLGVVAQVNPSTDFGALKPDATIPFIPMAAVATETGIFDASARRTVGDVAKGFVRFANGDVIFAKITPCMENGKVAPVHGLPGGVAAGSTEFHVFRPRAVDQRFLWHWLVSRGFRQRAQRNMSGSAGQLRVPVDWLRTADFPLPPLPEQRRIVERIDALFSEIAEGEAALDEARKGLDLFRCALLNAAVTGELTRDWRAASARCEIASAGRSSAERGLPPIPQGWNWVSLDDISDSIRNGMSAAPCSDRNANEILRISAVRPMWVDESQIRYLSDAQVNEGSDATVTSGDLLFTRYNGSADYVGVGAIYSGKTRFYPDKLIRVRLKPAFLPLAQYVELAVNCGPSRKHIASNIKTTAGQQGLSGASLKATPISLPPPAEAAEIIRCVSEALAAADDTRKILDAEAADVARLKQSILKAAFEGKLVPQDPADEPAAVTLARLSQETPPKTRRGKSLQTKQGRGK